MDMFCLSLFLSCLCSYLSISFCVCVCGQRCVVIAASAVNEKYTYKCKYSSIHTNTHSHTHTRTHTLTLSHTHTTRQIHQSVCFTLALNGVTLHTHTHTRACRGKETLRMQTQQTPLAAYTRYTSPPPLAAAAGQHLVSSAQLTRN